MIISYDAVYPLLMAACPSYDRSTQVTDADERDGEFLRVAQFVRHLIQLLDDDETDTFPAVFSVVEWVLEDGDDEARSLVDDGFLTDLTDVDLYRETGKHPSDFVPWLGTHVRAHPAIQPLL